MSFFKFNDVNGQDLRERRVRANDTSYNAQFNYANNYICTSKYTIVSFLPKNMFEQLQRLANAYFIGLLILQVIPWISSLTWVTTVVPLLLVMCLTAIKDAVDDYQRHRSDNQVNNRLSTVLRDGQLIQELWKNVVVGDIIKMTNNQFVAADLLLLSTSEPNSLCYIETAELDGETNLKVRQPLPETAALDNDLHKFGAFNGEVICEAPNNNLSKFEGRLSWNNEDYSLDNDSILLRGCVLRNTQWCYGLVVFSGHDSKLMMNSGETVFKRTNIDRLMNKLIIGIVCFLLGTCVICTVACGISEYRFLADFQQYLPWESFVPGTVARHGKRGTRGAGATVIAILVFFSYIIVLNTVVPISLYVSVEIIRMGNSLFINWDRNMYYGAKDDPAKARSTALNEELGQIEYIFSDKTGTLTQNIMEFKKATINGQSYGDLLDQSGTTVDVNENTQACDLSWNPYAESKFRFYDKRLVDEIRHDSNRNVDDFFKLLSLCHTVMPEDNEGTLVYQAQSPDEGALVSAARNFGYVFKSRTPTSITIEVKGREETYQLLAILDFNNVRKRMSVIVERDGRIQLWCKGADSVIYEHLDRACAELQEKTTHHLHEFAQDGLRTLCLAVKELSQEEFSAWKEKHKQASLALVNRDEKLDAVYEEIEQDLTLLGATAIEDKLQDGVPEAIANLARADIKIWVLTGDKQETAINIGYSCRLLTEDMEEVYVIDADDRNNVRQQLDGALQDIDRRRRQGEHTPDVMYGATNVTSDMTNEEMNFALVINGHSLAHCLKPELRMSLLELGCRCKAVICCRVTPLQKAMVVDLVKRNKQSITLAIGDGANDVSMIKTAHIGVGISGQEGMQAVLSSDYSFSQFRYLERLLLVHGRWSYLRMCKFLKYFFYKNFAFTLCNFWFGFFCGFSGQPLFDPFFISLYNVFYTALPVLVLGLFDQDVDDEFSIQNPKLYEPGLVNLLFNTRVFMNSAIEGAISSIVLFFVPYFAFKDAIASNGLDDSGLQFFGVAVASILVVAVNIRCAMDMSYWTVLNHITIWGSIVFYFLFVSIFYLPTLNYSYQGVAKAVFTSGTFWFTLLLTTVILIVPVLAYRFLKITIRPTFSDNIRREQRLVRKQRLLRPHSQSLPTRRSKSKAHKEFERSGYAFAHQTGFGALITSGSIMRLFSPSK